MDSRKVIEAVISGMEQGKIDFGIEYGVIVCAMRHHSTEDNMRMIKTAREYLGSGVCAADLAGAEALYPMSEFMDIFTNSINFFLKLKPEFTILALKDLVSLNKNLVKRLFVEELDNDEILDFIVENDYIFE